MYDRYAVHHAGDVLPAGDGRHGSPLPPRLRHHTDHHQLRVPRDQAAGQRLCIF